MQNQSHEHNNTEDDTILYPISAKIPALQAELFLILQELMLDTQPCNIQHFYIQFGTILGCVSRRLTHMMREKEDFNLIEATETADFLFDFLLGPYVLLYESIVEKHSLVPSYIASN